MIFLLNRSRKIKVANKSVWFRSWNTIQKGLEVSKKDKSETDEIKQNASR